MLTFLALGAPIGAATADDHRHHPGPGRPGPRHDFHGRDFHHFSRTELVIWQGGRWRHDWYGGRYGWWYVVGGVWYFYPEPIYPYPTYVPTVAVVGPPPVGPVIVQPVPAPAPPPPPPIIVQQAPKPLGPAPPQSWYYCDQPAGYYPYVQTCSSGFRPVPVTPR